MRQFIERNWMILLIALGILTLFIVTFVIPASKITIEGYKNIRATNENTEKAFIKPDITIAHIGKDGTIWVEINGNQYYLYLDDNGTQKRLEIK